MLGKVRFLELLKSEEVLVCLLELGIDKQFIK
jgi:hypothetical protein